jgi:hypothetical protein
LVEKAVVLHVGTFPLEEDVITTDLITPEEGGAPQAQPVQPINAVQSDPDIITLVVDPQQALAINYAVKAGVDIVLTLRGPDDFTETQTTMVSLEFLLNTYNMSVPTKLPYGLQPRLDQLLPPVLPNSGGEPTQ